MQTKTHSTKSIVIALIDSSRPKTLLVGAAPVLLGTAYSYSIHNTFSSSIFFLTLTCTLLLQTGTNLVNEYFDYKTGVDQDGRLGPKRSIQKGNITPKSIKNFFILCFLTSFLLGIKLMYIGGPVIISIGLLSIIIAYCYTGGPLPLSHIYLGEFLAFLFFGPVAVIGTSFIQVKTVTFELVLISLIPGLISATLMSLNNLRDIETDKTTNKKTIAIFLGHRKARIFTLLLAMSPIVISILINTTFSLKGLILLIPPFLFIPLWKKIYATQKMAELNEGIALIGKYNIIYCLFVSGYLLLKNQI